jgi:uncharacterized protein YndB with AHSA1/START domain
MSHQYDWSRFVTRIAINAAAEKLYALWATRDGIEYWFLRLSEYKTPEGLLRSGGEPAQKGDSYTWRWHGWGDETTEHGTILEANGRDFFKFTFAETCTCAVTIKEENGYRVVELVQENIPTDDKAKHNWHLGCKTGWTFYLANLKSMLEGGIDLRNRDEALKNVVNS